jgi:hypothetical protein
VAVVSASGVGSSLKDHKTTSVKSEKVKLRQSDLFEKYQTSKQEMLGRTF